MPPADEPDLHPGHHPEAVLRIATADALRAISDPTRLRLLEVMVQRQDPAWSVKELAAALGVPQTRLYHHVEQLVAHDLVRAVERRVVSGIIETRYRVTALNVQIDRRLFAGDPATGHAMLHDALVTVFDTARDEIEAALRAVAAQEERPATGNTATDAERAATGNTATDAERAATGNRSAAGDAPAAGNPSGADDRTDDDGDVERLGILVSRSLTRLPPARARELRARLNALVAEFGDEDTPEAGAWGVVVAVYPLPHLTEQSDG